jgi:chromosomal replication initiator protein
MSLSAAEVWDRLLARARQELPEQTFRTWLEPTAAALDSTSGTIVVGTPDRFSGRVERVEARAAAGGYAPVALGHPMT